FAAENYINDSESQSYAAEWLPAAQRVGEAHQAFAQSLPLEDISMVTLDDLIRFYRHPVRAFFQMRLGVNFILEETELPDEEPFTLDNLSRYQLNSQLLNQLIDGEEPTALFRRIRSAGGLPYGAFGEIYWEKQQEEMQEVAAKVREYRTSGHSIEIDNVLDGVRLTGWLQQVQDNGLVRWRPAVLGAVDGMALWIEHLFYCLSGGDGESRCFGRQNSAWHFAALSKKEAEKALLPLIEGYRQGRSSPLLLLPKTGWAWLNNCFDKDSGAVDWDEQTQSKAQMKLLLAWQGDQRVIGEGSDPYIQRVMRTMDEKRLREIQQLAEQYYLPLARSNLA
ncbi:MAG: exodeoxyribonuclease V subunit gamma, partial [Hafnia alvei]